MVKTPCSFVFSTILSLAGYTFHSSEHVTVQKCQSKLFYRVEIQSMYLSITFIYLYAYPSTIISYIYLIRNYSSGAEQDLAFHV